MTKMTGSTKTDRRPLDTQEWVRTNFHEASKVLHPGELLMHVDRVGGLYALSIALLYVEDAGPAADEPCVDFLTRKMAGAFQQAKVFIRYMGTHACDCGVHCSGADYLLPDGSLTNSLCVHYLAHHRDRISAEDLARVAAFDLPEVEPTAKMLGSPSA